MQMYFRSRRRNPKQAGLFFAVVIGAVFLLNQALCAQESRALRDQKAASTEMSRQGSLASDYVIREGDVVQVSVFNEPELSASGRVRRDGTLQCPLIGSIPIMGLSQTMAAGQIEEAYRKDYLVHPEVNLFVSQFTTQRVTLLGQVMKPGSHDLPAEKRLSILQILGMAGGTTRIANLKKVVVKRFVNGRQESFKIDVSSMISGSNATMFYVQEDDVITVPESMF